MGRQWQIPWRVATGRRLLPRHPRNDLNACSLEGCVEVADEFRREDGTQHHVEPVPGRVDFGIAMSHNIKLGAPGEPFSILLERV
jgi:hypothetical protein